MRLSEFILSNLESIAKEWEAFARTLSPSRSLTSRAVRNDLERMLRFIAADIETTQSDAQQEAKAAGQGPDLPCGALSAAHEHGLQRLAQSFSLVETISEFRALRASVTRLWLAQGHVPDRAQELIRFNEAMDQIVAESVLQFTGKLDRDRELLLGMVTHDLRNPLSVITSSGELLRKLADSNRPPPEVADRIVHAARRMESIINDLLDFTRTRLGTQLPVTRQRCDLADIARGTANELSADGRISVTARGDCTGQWDRGRITQLVANLLRNAQQHGDKTAPITVEVVGDSHDVHVWVRNSGPMIPSDEREAIFEPMLRGASARARGETTSLGLGLFIVRQIARGHGGTVELASSDERGTVFHVVLPREPS